MYEQLKTIILSDKPNGLKMVAADYPPAKMMSLLADVVFMVQLFMMLSLFIKDKSLPSVMGNNRVVSFFALWLGGSMVSSALTKTGAFEVYVGQKLIWSSIQNGRVPVLKDLIDSFQTVGVALKTPQS